jgi:hypothetical protein
MFGFILGLIAGVPVTVVITCAGVAIYDYIHKDEPPTKDEWKVM